jgi:hypothetical protein
VISVLAFALTIYQAMETRAHNELSVKPLLMPRREMNFTDNHQVGLKIVNEGLGPAKIAKFAVYFNGKPYSMTNRQNLKPIADATTDLYVDFHKVSWQILSVPDAIRVGDERWLYSTQASNVSEKSRDRFIDLMQNKLLFKMKVCSAYDICEEFCSGTAEACAALSKS